MIKWTKYMVAPATADVKPHFDTYNTGNKHQQTCESKLFLLVQSNNGDYKSSPRLVNLCTIARMEVCTAKVFGIGDMQSVKRENG